MILKTLLGILVVLAVLGAGEAVAQQPSPDTDLKKFHFKGTWSAGGNMGSIDIPIQNNQGTVFGSHVPGWGGHQPLKDLKLTTDRISFNAKGDDGRALEVNLPIKQGKANGWVYHAGQPVRFDLQLTVE